MNQEGPSGDGCTASAPGEHALWNVVFPTAEMGVHRHGSKSANILYGTGYDSHGQAVDPPELDVWFDGRRRVRIPAYRRFSTAGYFNAFPADYWCDATNVDRVSLSVAISAGATLTVWKSDQHARADRVLQQELSAGRHDIEVSITGMSDGGWLWFDIETGDDPVTLENSSWNTDIAVERDGNASIAITTMNKPEWCLRQFALLAEFADLSVIDEILVVDQGNKRVSEAEQFDEMSHRLGAKLRVIDQRNIGGSGGFSRGMYEVESRGSSEYALLLDDDTVLEPESVSRAIMFANHCAKPTIVGGNMLFLSEPTRLCSLAEVFNVRGIYWEQTPGTPKFPDMADARFTDETWLHKRADADYNAWWMCLIPVDIIKEIGLSYPFFIKNDDVEYGVRAKQAGFRTVTVPGVCLWHQSWVDKDDILDWQAYFHVRNKLIMGLLYSPYRCGGKLFRNMFRASASAAVKLRYSAVMLHQMAVKDVLKGPEYIGSVLETKLPDVRKLRSAQPDAQMQPLKELPQQLIIHNPIDAESIGSNSVAALFHQIAPLRKDARTVVDGYVEPTKVFSAVSMSVAQGHVSSGNVPFSDKAHLRATASSPHNHWKAMSTMDSAVAVSVEKDAGILLVRHPWKALRAMCSVTALYARLAVRWPAYRKRYREQFKAMTSPNWWNTYFAPEEER